MLSIGIDHGNYNTKSSNGLIYPSGYTVSTVRPVSDTDLLEYAGKYYSIGTRRFAVQYDKCTDEAALILTMPALGHAMQLANVQEEEFALGVGLPLSAYSTFKDKFKEYLHKPKGFHFIWRGIEYAARIAAVNVYPQGYAAYLQSFNDFARYENISFLDIGGYTIDIFQTYRGRLQAGSTKSLLTGTIMLLRRAADELARLDIRLTEIQLATAMSGGKVEHLRKQEVTDVLNQVRAEYVRDLANMLREHEIDVATPIVLIGGGAELLEAELRARMYVVGMLDKYANARGYKQWLERDLLKAI